MIIDQAAARLLNIEMSNVVADGLRILLILVLAVAVLRAGRRLLARFEKRLQVEDNQAGRSLHRSRTLALVSRSALGIVVWTLAVLQILLVLGFDLGPLIASAGIAGIALGFGAQSLVRDFLTGFFVLLEDQYALGDAIEIDGAAGVVERFTFRLTSVRALDGTLHHISNGQIKLVSNSSAGWSKAIIDVGVAYDEDLVKVRSALDRAGSALAEDPQVGPLMIGPVEFLGVETFGKSEVVVRVALKTVPGQRVTVARAYRERLKKTFEREGISAQAAANQTK